MYFLNGFLYTSSMDFYILPKGISIYFLNGFLCTSSMDFHILPQRISKYFLKEFLCCTYSRDFYRTLLLSTSLRISVSLCIPYQENVRGLLYYICIVKYFPKISHAAELRGSGSVMSIAPALIRILSKRKHICHMHQSCRDPYRSGEIFQL